MIKSSLKPIIDLHLFLLLISYTNSFHLIAATRCHDNERAALLQFKQSFVIDTSVSGEPFAYPKLSSWKHDRNASDCCSWDGVECDADTGRVIGLDLGSSFIYGSINSSSSLFSLVHLRTLNLADNHLNYSQIPPEIANLSQLSSLNLSYSVFSGDIPSEFLRLQHLVSLDLSFNVDPLSYKKLINLQDPSLKSLAENLTNLKFLLLNKVNISSAVPDALANMHSLKVLELIDCGLLGVFPESIFLMPNLQHLDLQSNGNLTGHLPEFHNSSHPLEVLRLASTGFSGKIPLSLGSLKSMSKLDLSECNFSGPIPASLGNLTDLSVLLLSSSKLNGGDLSWLRKLTKLTWLELTDTNLQGEIPSSLSNLTQLTFLRLGSNHLIGRIPSWLMNLTQLVLLDLTGNQLQGSIPSSFSLLNKIDALDLSYNNFSGTVEADVFLSLKTLTQLRLSGNHISLLTGNTANSTSIPKFKLLELVRCNLGKFPDFLRYQDKLEVLLLESNNIYGRIPTWIWNTSAATLGTLSLANNLLTEFQQNSDVLQGASLRILDLTDNLLQGSLPVPPPNIMFYSAASNRLTGELSPSICEARFLYSFDVSNNSLSGAIPPCLSNFSTSLSLLNLGSNKFTGIIPQAYTGGCNLKVMDLSQNHLEGRLPKSLANCSQLEVLNLGDNQITDTFPSWLGALSELQVLALRSNNFHGLIGSSAADSEFPKLRIIDLSSNEFSGDLPEKYLECWNAMKVVNMDLNYMQSVWTVQFGRREWDYSYVYGMVMTNKGVKLIYTQIPDIFIAIDLSDNFFSGEIPDSIGNLLGLQMLNISKNELSGHIPSVIRNLTNLESLDLSNNKLSGEIPPEAAQLNFLAYFNVSYNHLTGPIPKGEQFNTFENTSYKGNPGLCGEPLSNRCQSLEGRPPSSPPVDEGDGDSTFPSRADLVVVSMGVVSGLIVGIIFGQYLTARNHEWFVDKFGGKGMHRRNPKSSAQRMRVRNSTAQPRS